MTRPDVAYYYPAPYWSWHEGTWIKSLLLFFDRVAILLPGYMYGRHEDADPTLVGPLEEQGLLQILEPNEWVDADMTHELTETVMGLLASGTFDDLPSTEVFHELSQSRIGYGADVDLADMLVEELEARGLARPSEDGVSVPLHPDVRNTILVILAQLSRAAGARHNLTIHPATSDNRAVSELLAVLAREKMPTAERVISLDLEPVTFDLDPVPLDDVLDFRKAHHEAHKTYMRDLHRFMAELAAVDDPRVRESLLLERRQEISDAADDLRRNSKAALGKNLTSWSFGLAGASWSVVTGDPFGAILAAAGLTLPGLFGKVSNHVSAYSYVFASQRRFDAR